MQDFYDCRAGDFVWGVYQLGAGGDILDWEDDGDCLKRNKETIYGVSMKGRLTGLNGFVGLLFLVVFLTLFAYNKKYIET